MVLEHVRRGPKTLEAYAKLFRHVYYKHSHIVATDKDPRASAKHSHKITTDKDHRASAAESVITNMDQGTWDRIAWDRIKRARTKPFINKHQERLLSICFGAPVPKASELPDLPRNDVMNFQGLQIMALMTLIDFFESIRKDKWKEDTLENREPQPFDVFVMKALSGTRRRGDYLAVVLPLQKGRGAMWYDGGNALRPLDELKYKGRIANLVGPARVLKELPDETGKCSPNLLGLSLLAMKRSDLREPPLEWKKLLEPHEHKVIHLNDSQKSAVATVMSPSFTKGFFVVQGPPGTGKTTTMVAMISVMKAGILVVAPSNAALANIALKLHSTGRYNLNEIVVFGRNSDPSVHFLNPLNRGEKFREYRLQYEKNKGKPIVQTKILQECKAWLHMAEMDATIDELGSFCPNINLETKSGRRKMGHMISHSKIIFSTLNSAGSNLLRNNAIVRTALFDEAGQASEADFYILTNFPGIERITLVGDPMQLPATVLHQRCKDAGYGESWMKRVQEKYPQKVHLLNTQYRMDPKIIVFPNKSFYNKKIKNGENVSIRKGPKVRKPFQWVDTCGHGSEQKVDMSWKNEFEAEAIRELLHTDGDIQRLLQVEPTARIIVITPYRTQVKLLHERLKSPRKTARLDIATIDSFQGQEGDVVVFSTVRTKKLGFIDDANRLNVAITRAKRILRVVGDAKFFQSKTGSVLSRLCDHALETDSISTVSKRVTATQTEVDSSCRQNPSKQNSKCRRRRRRRRKER